MALLHVALPFSNATNPSFKLSRNGTHNIVLANPSTIALPFAKRNYSRFTVKCSAEIRRGQFPSEFLFGGSSSALQTESGATDGGRGESTWDEWLDGQEAVRSLYKYNEDVLCLKNMGMDVYRMSISWPRLFPSGKVSDETVNQEGVTFYKNFFTQLKLNGIEPFVTLFHFDLPKALQTEYNGTLSPNFVDDFNAYANFCFKTFGDQVKHWTTLNEPWVWSIMLYNKDLTIADDPTRYPYTVGHNLLKAHATAVKTYKKTYQATQKGKIGITLNMEWFLPYSNSRQDRDAARRAWDFMSGWFLDPLVTGDYPFSMKAIVKERLPVFTKEDRELIKDSFDFIGINYYTSNFAKSVSSTPGEPSTGVTFDQHYESFMTSKTGAILGPVANGNSTMSVYPKGIYQVLSYIKEEYHNPLIYITENGYPQKRDDEIPIAVALQDDVRVDFHRDHLNFILNAISEGSNVRGYFIWNLLDCLEVGGDAYTVRFGLNYTDYENNYNRIPKKSANWLKQVLAPSVAPTPIHPPKPE